MEISIGNKKLGRDTAIINFTSATDCPSKRLGLCRHCDICYAMKAERQYPAVLPYRRRQALQWQRESLGSIKAGIVKHSKVKYIRFSEAGDFKDQNDVNKLAALARIMPDYTFYGYTARQDLSFKNVPDNVVIQGSGFRVHNTFNVIFKPVPSSITCPGNCRDCNLCKVRKNININVLAH